MLQMILMQRKGISFCACITQMYFFMLFSVVELYLLSAMAYDRYAAICNPLSYTVIMNKTVCLVLAVGCWLLGSVVPLSHTILLSQSTFCGTREINHFFCDPSALMMISCSGTARMELFTYTIGTIFAFSPFLLTLMSYVFIITTILRIRSTTGKRKAFTTCSSHLMVVVLFYSSVLGIYVRPTSNYSMDENKMASIVYVNAVPLLNPLIYGLRNKEVKKALWNAYGKQNSCLHCKTARLNPRLSFIQNSAKG
ncbi:olfactory receptor 5V1-like [Lissotriton helveticus]